MNIDQAKSLIIERSKQLVEKVVELRGTDKPPFSPSEFANILGVKKIERADLGEISGLLLRLSDGPVIQINRTHNQSRQIFSCAHEIGHLLFSELKLEQYINTIEHRTFNPTAQQKARSYAVERLCDIAASELLMPENIFKQHLMNFGVTIASVEKLSNTFQVSLSAAIRRISEISIEPCIALIWRPLQKSKTLNLVQCSGPENSKSFSPVYTKVKYPSLLHKALEEHVQVKSYNSFKIGTQTKRLLMESKGFGYDNFQCVVSLAFPNR
jgi:Zn-dependent peptidase ImmA (M78 family)